MSKVRFLCDENVSVKLIGALRQEEPGMDILCVEEPGAPPKRTPDPDLLLTAEAMARALLTCDRSTMPGHLVAHFTAGHHTWGTFLMRNGFTLKRFVDELRLIWGASEADEWIDRTVYIP